MSGTWTEGTYKQGIYGREGRVGGIPRVVYQESWEARMAHIPPFCWSWEARMGLFPPFCLFWEARMSPFSLLSACSGRLEWALFSPFCLFWEARMGPFPPFYSCSGRLEWALSSPFCLFWEAGRLSSQQVTPLLGGWEALFHVQQ